MAFTSGRSRSYNGIRSGVTHSLADRGPGRWPARSASASNRHLAERRAYTQLMCKTTIYASLHIINKIPSLLFLQKRPRTVSNFKPRALADEGHSPPPLPNSMCCLARLGIPECNWKLKAGLLRRVCTPAWEFTANRQSVERAPFTGDSSPTFPLSRSDKDCGGWLTTEDTVLPREHPIPDSIRDESEPPTRRARQRHQSPKNLWSPPVQPTTPTGRPACPSLGSR